MDDNELEQSNDELLDDFEDEIYVDDDIDSSIDNSASSFPANRQINFHNANNRVLNNKKENLNIEKNTKDNNKFNLPNKSQIGNSINKLNPALGKLGGNKLTSGLSKLGGKLPGLNKLSGLNKFIGNKKKNNENDLGENTNKDNTSGNLNSGKQKAIKNEMNTGKTASDTSKNVTKAIIDKIPPTLKIQLIIGCVFFIVITLIFLVIISYFTNNKVNDNAATSSYVAKGQASYQGGYYDIKGYLVEAGYCDEDDCENSNAYKYIYEINELFSDYNTEECSSLNLNMDHIVNLIVSAATYDREVEDYYGLHMSEDEYEEQLDIYMKEYKALFDAAFYKKTIASDDEEIDDDGTETCYEFSESLFKSYIISEDGFLDTYREDLGELTDSEKDSIYSTIIGDTEEVEKIIEESNEKASNNIVSGGSMIISSICTGVTVTGENSGVYSLDEYVAGVIENENNWYQGNNIENMKAQAVAARTYLLRKTNNCKNSIENSASAQTFNPNPSEKAKQAALETSNQVLVDSNGNYISAEYDAFAVKEITSDFYILKQAGLQIPVSWVTSHISNANLKYYETHHHGRGMSQWGSRYLQTIGYTYDKILSTFYDGSNLKTLGNSVTSGIPNNVNDLKNRYYFNFDINIYQGNTLFGQCVWYAKHRAMEILSTAPVNESIRQTLIKSIQNTAGNGQDWYKNPSNTYFKKSSDINQPKAGSIVSWTRGQYGHVAIIEKVYTDSNGQIMVTLTDGWRQKGTDGSWYITNDLWSVVKFRKKDLTLSELRTFGGTFNGYVYLY